MNQNQHLTLSQRFERIVERSGGPDLMAAFFNTAPFLNSWAGVPLKDYYFDPAIKMKVQMDFQAAIPQAICIPGIWADFGALLEPSAFGCEIAWPSEDGMPMAQPVISGTADIAHLKPVDPLKDGLMPQALDQFRYFQEHLDPGLREEYGYLDGVAASFGPVELGAVLMGHGRFYLALGEEPQALHELFKVTTESVISWLRACQEINGPLNRVVLADHIPGQVSQEHVQEFFIPYTNQVMAQFPGAHFIWHNEYPLPYPGVLEDMPFSVFHFGGPVQGLLPTMGKGMVLMGNLEPMELRQSGDAAKIASQTRDLIKSLAGEHHFLISTAGGLAPETPEENLLAMVQAVEDAGINSEHP